MKIIFDSVKERDDHISKIAHKLCPHNVMLKDNSEICGIQLRGEGRRALCEECWWTALMEMSEIKGE